MPNTGKPNPQKLWMFHGLNCVDTHALEVHFNGGTLIYGKAKDPSGIMSSHTWVVRGGKVVDLFNWTDHVAEGERPGHSVKDLTPLLAYLHDNDIEWDIRFKGMRVF